MKDPFAVSAPRPIRQPFEIANERRNLDARRKLSYAERKEILRPFINRGIAARDGTRVSRKEWLAERETPLRALATELEKKAVEKSARIDAYLEAHGDTLPEELRTSISDVQDGIPVFMKSLGLSNWNEFYLYWPGSPYQTDVTGAGSTITMWDFGQVKTNHEQFQLNQVTNVDSGGSLSEHATAVASILVGNGDPTDLTPAIWNDFNVLQQGRGISYGANLRVRDAQNDTLEMALDLLDPQAELVFSNHSYGTTCGWQKSQTGPVWFWHGNPTISQNEDFKFGAYLAKSAEIDRITYEARTYLPVFAAGNERRNVFGDYPGDLDHGPDSQPVSHRVNSGGGFVLSTIQRNLDGGTTGQDTILPEACSKNVLTVGSYGSIADISSSSGYTDDSRRKPDIVASGGNASGTDSILSYVARVNPPTTPAFPPDQEKYQFSSGSSFAAASVTAALNLTKQRWESVYGTDHQVLASTWKALAIACSGERPTEGHHPSTGYGRFRAHYLENEILVGDMDPSSGLHSRVKEVIMENGKTIEFRVFGNQADFSVTICWTDPPGPVLPNALDRSVPMLVNDLDIVVESESGVISYPGSSSGNHRDNVEKVRVFDEDSLEPSIYTVRISVAKDNLGIEKPLVNAMGQPATQPVSIVIRNTDAVELPFRIIDFSHEMGGDEALLTWNSSVGGIYQIEKSADLSVWTPLNNVEILADAELTTAEIAIPPSAIDHQYFRVKRLW